MLFAKELKKICFSIIYIIFLILLILGWYRNFGGVTTQEITSAKTGNLSEKSQIIGGSILHKPEKENANYGAKQKEVPDKMMLGGTDMLIIEYCNNSYATYPFGYYKEVILDSKEQNKILDILSEITGLTEKQIRNLPNDYFPAVNGNIVHPSGYQIDGKMYTVEMGADDKSISENENKTEHFVPQVSYDRFKELMEDAEDIIGDGSNYSMEMLLQYYGQTEMNYEEAVAEYEKTIYQDKVSNAFARLFCDYLTRSLGLYPVFVAVVFWMKDRRNKMNELIGCKQIGTKKIILIRYLAMITAMILPVILLSFESLIPLQRYSAETGIVIDAFAFVKYIIWWLLPTVMIVTALAMILTVLTSSPVAILVQIVWWFVDSGITGLSGDTGLFTLMIRHNTLNGLELVQEDLKMICVNRGLLIALAVILIVLTCSIYDKKRKGEWNCAYWYQRYFGIFKERFYSGFQK